MCATPAPNCYFVSVTVWNAVCGVHFHHKCAPLPHRSATLYPPRSITVIRCVLGVIFSFPGCPWLPLTVPGCSWPDPGCSLLLLAAPGLLPAAHGCSWLPLAAPGYFWLLLMLTVDLKKTSCLGLTLRSYQY
jgi:hypothetical protein